MLTNCLGVDVRVLNLTAYLLSKLQTHLRGHSGQKGGSVHRSKSSCDTSGMLDAKRVGSLLSWILGPTKKARRYLHGCC